MFSTVIYTFSTSVNGTIIYLVTPAQNLQVNLKFFPILTTLTYNSSVWYLVLPSKMHTNFDKFLTFAWLQLVKLLYLDWCICLLFCASALILYGPGSRPSWVICPKHSFYHVTQYSSHQARMRRHVYFISTCLLLFKSFPWLPIKIITCMVGGID